MSEDINHLLIKNFINKNYKICKLHPTMPVFDLIDIMTSENKSNPLLTKWEVETYLKKIFSVNTSIIKIVFNDIVSDERKRIKATQYRMKGFD